MSIEIMYGRQFVKLDDEHILPLTLSGSSNCTMFIGGREILEREWNCLINGIVIPGASVDEYRKALEKLVSNNPDGEWFRQGGKMLIGKNILKWFDSGCKSAATIEEIKQKYPQQSIKCSLMGHSKDKNDYHSTMKFIKYCDTTEEIKEWLATYSNYKDDEYDYYIHMGLLGIKPVSMGKPVKENTPLIVKIGSRYLTDISEFSMTRCGDIKQAKVFANKEEFEKTCLPWRFSNKYRLISATAALVTKPYIIVKAENEKLIVKKVSSRHCFYTTEDKQAKTFKTENEAKKWKEKYLDNRFISPYKIITVEG